MPRLYAVRHGLTDWNALGRIQGHAQSHLTESGRRQAELIADRLSSERIDAVYSSDLTRAMDTARAIAGCHGLPVHADSRLREADYGDWEGRTMDELRVLYPEVVDRWMTEPVAVAPVNGESVEQVAARVSELLDELRARPEDEQIVVVGHGGSIRALLCLALSVPQGYSRRVRVDTASLSIVQLTPARSVVMSVNDRHHLVDADVVDTFIAF
ncbi:MAG: histidine phosphatase family protein [Chloroflexi bacterium]|nr:histidine phosphatase family protein [Chloroflexota bacterium]